MSFRTDQPVQVYRRTDGGFAFKDDRSPLGADEMLIGRGLDPEEALALIDEFNAAATGRPRAQRGI